MQLIGVGCEGEGKWWGSVLARNGYIYLIPFYANKVLKIDPSTNTTTLIGDDLGEGRAKWSGSRDGKNGCIYGVPCRAKAVLKLNTKT